MIFADTSAIYALADTDDERHALAFEALESAKRDDEEFATHNYVLVESAALLQRRLGRGAALKFLAEASQFTIFWVDPETHDSAAEYMEQHGSAKVSFVDAVSFVVMRQRGIEKFFGFDRHFVEAGFIAYGP